MAFASGRACAVQHTRLCGCGGSVSVTCASTGHMEPRGCTLQLLLGRIRQTNRFRIWGEESHVVKTSLRH
eukprot:6709762-Prymnesium_polylepis.1